MSSDLARRIGFTIGALLVFRLGTHVPLPGFEPRAWDWIFHQQSSGILGIVNVFAGGAIGRMAIFALGIAPYLSAAIILQLASMALPSLRALPKRGESGRRRLE